MDNKIKNSYKKINISESAKDRIAMAITADEVNKASRNNIIKIKRVKIAVAACLAVILGLPAAIYAAQKIYQYYNVSVNENGDYGLGIEMTKSDNDESEAIDNTQQYIELVADFGNDYIPENEFYGWESYGDKDDTMISYNHKDGFKSGKCFWYDLYYMDCEMDEIMSVYDTEMNEMIMINDRKAVYSKQNEVVGSKYTDKDLCDYGQSIYVFIEDYGYILELAAQNGLSKEEFIHVAEGIKIEKAESKDDASGYTLLSESQLSGWNVKLENKASMEEIHDKNLVSKNAKIGETIFELKEVKILDSIAGLNKDAFITDYFDMKSLVSENGMLKKYERELLKIGDGVTEPEAKVIDTENVSLKLVYVTLEIDNSDALSVDGLYYAPSISFVTNKDGKNYVKRYREEYNRPKYVDEALMDFEPCYIEESCGGKDAWAVKASKDKIVVHYGYLVDEDFTDGMALWLNDYGSSAEERYCLEISDNSLQK